MIMDKRIRKYIESVNEVSQTTFDPHGPGCVRIHLLPPKKIKPGVAWTIILNGQSVIPISFGWAVLLREFINAVNRSEKVDIDSDKLEGIIDETVANVLEVFPKPSVKLLKNDLKEIIKTLVTISKGEKPDVDIGYMTLAEYSKYMSAPHRMDVMVSSMSKDGCWHCNQKCIHCYAGHQEYANVSELSTDEWKKIIDKCREALIPQITFTGGEPTLRDDLIELIKYSEWFVSRLNTNGQKLTKEYCEELYEANLDNVQITFYSHDENIHNTLVGVQGYKKTLEGIKNAVDAKLSVSVNTPLCTLNSDYISTVKFLHENYGVTYFTCSGLILTGKAKDKESNAYRLTKEDILKSVKEAYAYAVDNACEISFTSPGWISDEELHNMRMSIPSCGACSSNMAITPNGYVVPCQSWLSSDVLGSMLNDNWKDIWESKRCKELRKENVLSNGICPLSQKEEI